MEAPEVEPKEAEEESYPVTCCHFRHPHLQAVLAHTVITAEAHALARRAGVTLELALDDVGQQRAHSRSARRYCLTDLDTSTLHIAPQFRLLPYKQRFGLFAHEIGHLLLADVEHTEAEADAAAEAALGCNISYDRRWGGKGLQTLRWSR